MTLHLSDEEMEKFLSCYSRDPRITNIDAEEILRCGTREDDMMGTPKVYAFGRKGEGDRELNFSYVCRTETRNGAFIRIPVADERYGLPTPVIMNPRNGPLDVRLNPASRRAYEQLRTQPCVPFRELLELVGYTINNSMRFVPKVSSSEKAFAAAGETYVPTGEETLEGDCNDAGILIRELLYSLNPTNVRYGVQRPSVNGITHNATAVLAVDNGTITGWGIINSKSPRLPYNLVPAEAVDLYVPRSRR